MLEPEKPPQAGSNLGLQLGSARALGDAEAVEGAPDDGVRESSAHGLLNTAIGEPGQVLQAGKQGAGDRAADLDPNEAAGERILGVGDHCRKLTAAYPRRRGGPGDGA